MDRVPVALIEQLDAHGQVLDSWPVQSWPCRIGRAFDADVRLDDPYTAAEHAILTMEAAGPVLTVGETVNGALIEAKALVAGESRPLPPGAVWRLGHTRLRLRLPGDPVAPERRLGRHGVQAAVAEATVLRQAGWRSWLPWALLTLLWTLWDMWRDQDPGTPARDYLSGLLITAGVVAGWTLLWSLGSKLFQGRLQYAAHLRLALIHGLVWSAVVAALPALAFMFGWPVLSRMADWVGAAVLCRLVWAHLCVLQPGHRAALAAGLATLFIAGVGLRGWFNQQATGSVFAETYAATVLPPSWLLASPVPVETLAADLRAWRPEMDARARRDEAEATGGDLDDALGDFAD
ncbi:hypothetical protein GTZ97_08765 [Aquabacterium fontiphilum]|uniref:FHA domain-containing protein n=1 Tax=Aquabacterium fontiphilum TaxID=450365 RepID=UPI001377BAA2|nr:FHA domain-containing protein [Aquabacterium fontiphilum]NBD20758.1 hypothetical protein [Aquabacterium fontiphilum]